MSSDASFRAYLVKRSSYGPPPPHGYFEYAAPPNKIFWAYEVRAVAAGAVPEACRFGVIAVYATEGEARAAAAILASTRGIENDDYARVLGLYDEPCARLVIHITFINETGEGGYIVQACSGGVIWEDDDRWLEAIFPTKAEAESYVVSKSTS